MGVAWAWSEGAGQDSAARLGATWSAWFFPTLPSLHGVMNGFLLVCGRGPGLKSILTKAQNTHSSQPASLRPELPTAGPPAANWLCENRADLQGVQTQVTSSLQTGPVGLVLSVLKGPNIKTEFSFMCPEVK